MKTEEEIDKMIEESRAHETREEKINKIVDIFRKHEESLSDGYKWYCAINYGEYGFDDDEYNKAEEEVDEVLKGIAKEILDAVEQKR